MNFVPLYDIFKLTTGQEIEIAARLFPIRLVRICGGL